MPFNGSGTFTPEIDWTTEAASPPIEISKLDTQDEDMADGLTNCLTRDGQSPPTGNIPMGGFRITGLGAATALTDGVSATVIIDQELHYYVDSGSANTYAITPAPAIAAYEEGQRFVVRIANGNSGASTLNVNGLGAFAIQTIDGSALASGMLVTGGIYEFTYDANTSPDRWVITSPTAKIPDGFLSSNIPQLDDQNVFLLTANSGVVNTFQNPSTGTGGYAMVRVFNSAREFALVRTSSGYSGAFLTSGPSGEQSVITAEGNFPLVIGTQGTARAVIDGSGNFDFKAGTVTTNNASASEVGFKGTPQNVQNGDYTLVLTDAGKSIDKQSGGAGETITIPANGSVAFPVGTVICGDNDGGGTLTIAITSDTLEDTLGNTGSRTVADNGFWHIKKIASTKWRISGVGIS